MPAHEELQATKETARTEPSVAANAQRPRAKMKLSKSERALKKAKAALKLAEANVEAEMISIKKQHKVQKERDRQARERDAKALKVSPPCPPDVLRAYRCLGPLPHDRTRREPVLWLSHGSVVQNCGYHSCHASRAGSLTHRDPPLSTHPQW